MNLTKCDICKKNLKGEPVKAGVGYLGGNDFCSKCGKPVLDFLKKHKLLDEEKNNMNNKKTKKVTIADLAKMIKEDVVDCMATKEDLKNLEERMATKTDIEGLKGQIQGVGKRIDDFVTTRVKNEDHNKLKVRVGFIEEKLKIKVAN